MEPVTYRTKTVGFEWASTLICSASAQRQANSPEIVIKVKQKHLRLMSGQLIDD
jgi:hypothetical protein